MSPITECHVVMETERDGTVKLHGMFLDSIEAYEQVCKIVEGKGFNEVQNENDHTVWITDDSMVEIRLCPCHLELR